MLDKNHSFHSATNNVQSGSSPDPTLNPCLSTEWKHCLTAYSTDLMTSSLLVLMESDRKFVNTQDLARGCSPAVAAPGMYQARCCKAQSAQSDDA